MPNGDRRNDISGRDRQGGRDGAPAEVRAASVRGSGQDRVVHEALATQLRGAFNARDIDAFHSLLAEGATWGEDPSSDSFCRDRNDIIRHLKQLLAEGVRATIVETTTGPRGIAAHVEVEWPEPDGPRPDPIRISQVYVVTDGLVTEIHGHDDKDSALAAISD